MVGVLAKERGRVVGRKAGVQSELTFSLKKQHTVSCKPHDFF